MRPPKRLQHLVAATVAATIAAGLASDTASARIVQTIGASGPQKLRLPDDVALGPDGSIYVLDHGDSPRAAVRIKVYAPAGTLLRSWRVNGIEFGAFDIAVDVAGNAYVVANGSPTILKYSPIGQLLARWQVPASDDPRLDFASWIAVDPRGNLLISEANGRLQTFDGQGRVLATWLRAAGPVAVDPAGTVFSADGHAVVALGSSGEVVRRIAQVRAASSLAAGPQGALYVVEEHRILKLGTDGRLLGSVGSDRRLSWRNAAVAADGSIYVPEWHPILGIAAVVKLAPITAVDATAPSVRIDSASKPSRRLLTRLTCTLSEDSSLRIVIKRRAATTDRRNRYFGRYMHLLTLDRKVTSGRHTFVLDWRTAGYLRRAPGDYQLTLVARDDAGNESRPARVQLSAPRR
jgi:hypothetical protein